MSDVYVAMCDVVGRGVATYLIGVFDELDKAKAAAQTWFDDEIEWDKFTDPTMRIVALGTAEMQETQWALEEGAWYSTFFAVERCALNEAVPRPLTSSELNRKLDESVAAQKESSE